MPIKPVVLLGILPVILITALLASLPARGQLLGLGFESRITLNRQDLDLIHQTVDRKIHGKPAGTSASWSNPDSQNHGTIKLLRKYGANGRHCEAVQYTLATTKMAVSPEHYVLNSCLQPDGTWKIS